MKLTQNRVESARPGKTRRRIADADVIGLHLVVQPSGAKSYVVRGRICGGRTRPVIDMTLGSTDALTLGEARTRAKIALARMQSGEDPRADRDGEIAVGDLIDLFLNYHRQRRTVTLDKIERCLRRVCAGLTRQPAQTVTKAQWAEAVGRTRKRNSLSAAQADAQWVRAMARWADDEGIAENLPAMRVVSPKASIAEKAEAATRTADRWTLRQEDWRAFWEGTAKLEDPTWRAYLRALAESGLRRSEAALARWKDVDLNTGIWTIPAVHTKSGRPHQVYIGPLLQEVLRSIPTTDSELVFPGRGGVVLSGWSKRLPRARRTIDLPVQLHGLRRGYRTALTELRTDRDVAELMVAHSREDLEARYDLSELSDLRREAQEKLEEAWMGVIL